MLMGLLTNLLNGVETFLRS